MFRLSLLGFASFLTLGALALTAAAPPVHPKASPAAAKPAAAAPITLPDGGSVAMNKHAGVVLPTVEVQIVFLGDDWASSSNPTLQGNLNTAADAIVTGPYLDALTPFYGVGHGTHDSTVNIPRSFVNKTISQADLEKLIVSEIGGRLKPLDANRLYLIYPPPGVSVQNLAASANNGAHAWFFPGSQPVSYAVINTTGSLAGVTAITSHEVAEGATDPSGQGYFDDHLVNKPNPYHPEIGDLTDGVLLDGKQYTDVNATLNGVVVQLLIDPTGNVIQVPGATPDRRFQFKTQPGGPNVAKPRRR